MLTGSIIAKHSSLSQNMGFPKVQSVLIFHFLETISGDEEPEEEPSSEDHDPPPPL